MTKKVATRSAQWPLVQEFVMNYNDWAIDSVSGVKKTLCSTVAASTDPAEPTLTAGTNLVFDAIAMPLGAHIIGGTVQVETAFNGTSTNTMSVGIAGAATTFTTTTDLETAGITAFTNTTTIPLACNAGQNIRLTFANGGADATQGKVRVRVEYTIDGRANENSIT